MALLHGCRDRVASLGRLACWTRHLNMRIGIMALTVLFLAPIPGASAGTVLGPWTPVFKGIDHAVGTNTPGGGGFSTLQVAHVMRVDLTDPDIQLLASPRITNYVANSRETSGMTVSDFLVTNRLQVAINANDFDPTEYVMPLGTPMDVHGLMVSRGEVVSTQDGAANSSSLLFKTNNQPAIYFTNWPPVSTAGYFTAVSATYAILVAGVNVGYQYQNAPGFIHQVQPRTAFGLSQDRRMLYLLTIDGRQSGYSDGALDYQTAAWLLLAGAYDGVNMDGGGSATLVMMDSTGQPVEVNHSSAVASYGVERTVGSHFGVYAKPRRGFINDVATAPDDTAAIVTWNTAAPATSQVEYGLTLDFGSVSALQPAAVTNHAVLLSGLTPGTSYYFRALSQTDTTSYVSSNFVFTTTNYVATLPLFDLTHGWKYSRADLDGVNWTARTYDDSAWSGPGPGLLWIDVRSKPIAEVQPKSTPLPRNPNDSNYPYYTYYFRTHFSFTDRTAGASLLFTSYVDDGAVFYLNGAEIYRLNLPDPPTPITNDMLALGYTCGGDATCPVVFTIAGDSATNLVAGDNVLAVEVHNYAARSPDVTFGTNLDYNEPSAVPPTLSIGVADGTTILSWERIGFVLQAATDPSGAWTDLPGPVFLSPYSVARSGQAQYFRLRKY